MTTRPKKWMSLPYSPQNLYRVLEIGGRERVPRVLAQVALWLNRNARDIPSPLVREALNVAYRAYAVRGRPPKNRCGFPCR